MRDKLVPFFAVVLLAGCATSFDVLDEAMPKIGTLNDAIKYLGYPTRQQKLAGKDVYEWTTSSMFMMPNVSTSMSTGYVGRSPINVNTTSTAYSSDTLSCKIRLVTENDIVISWDYDGNNGACALYSNRLKSLTGKK